MENYIAENNFISSLITESTRHSSFRVYIPDSALTKTQQVSSKHIPKTAPKKAAAKKAAK